MANLVKKKSTISTKNYESDSMSFFTDTNVPIGYTIIHDKWHEDSKKFYKENKKEDIFWSTLVKKEYGNTLKNITKLTESFLNKSNYFLRNNTKDFVNYKEFENYILKQTKSCCLDDTKKIRILEEFWNKHDFIEGISEQIYDKFKSFSDDFEKIYFKRDNKLNNIMILHNCGLNNYSKYPTIISNLNRNGIHDPDYKIIIDAHDCGLFHDELTFVSNDGEMLESISKINTSYLKIIEFKSCT